MTEFYSTERGDAKEDKAEDALTRRKKFGPMRWGMKRAMTDSAVNQVIRPAVAIGVPKPACGRRDRARGQRSGSS